MTDSRRLADPRALIARLPADVGIIVRHYGHPNRGALAEDIVRRARRRGLLVLVAGDAALARRTGAGGVHLPGRRRRPRPAHRPAHWVVTAAVHGLDELAAAGVADVDAVLVSPVFPTTTRIQRRALGLVGLRRLAARTDVPVIALGGLDPARIRRLGVGADGFAAIGAFARLAPAGRGPPWPA